MKPNIVGKYALYHRQECTAHDGHIQDPRSVSRRRTELCHSQAEDGGDMILAECRRLLGMQVPIQRSTESQPDTDYRDRYEELTGCSLRQCPQCRQDGHCPNSAEVSTHVADSNRLIMICARSPNSRRTGLASPVPDTKYCLPTPGLVLLGRLDTQFLHQPLQ